MKKLIISLIFLSISLNAYSFWIWSPKTQKWKNPKYSAMALPYLQYEEGLKWFEEGNYEVKVRSIDEYGAESEWSDPLIVSMPRNKAINIPILKFLENHPHMFPILRQILRLQ